MSEPFVRFALLLGQAREEQSAASEEINQSIVQVNDMVGQTAQAMREASGAVEELAQQADEGVRLATLARRQTVTLLFAAKNTEQNHALVLADWLRHL